MKALILALALVPTVCFAKLNQPSFIENAPVLKTFVCQKYTDNKMTMNEGFITDNPVVEMETTIEQTKFEMRVLQNVLFEDGLNMTIPEGGSISGVSGTLHDMMFSKLDGEGKPYFIIYMSNTSQPVATAGINRGVVLADCSKQ